MYGSSNKSCALETPARVQIGNAPQRAYLKSRGWPIWINIFVSRRRWETQKVWNRIVHGDVGLQLAQSGREGGWQIIVTATLCRSRLPE